MNDMAKLLPIIKLRKLSRHKIDIQESILCDFHRVHTSV